MVENFQDSRIRTAGSLGGGTPKKFLIRLTAIATLGGLLFGFDTGVISGALLYMRSDLGLTVVQEALVVTLLLFPGATGGALLGGTLADRLGRKNALLVCSVLFIVGALGCALAPTVSLLMLARVVLGFGVGCASVICPIYLAEMAPADLRPRMVTINELMIVTGLFVAFSTNLILDQLIDDPVVWRYMLGVAVIPAIALLIGMTQLPDSPRWYALKGRFEESLATLRLGRDEATAERDFAQIMNVTKSTTNGGNNINAVINTLREHKWMRRILWIGMAWGVAFIVPGNNVVNYYAPSVLTDSGMTNSAALMSSIAVGITQIIATFIGIWLLGFMPIRRMMLIGFSAIIVSHICLAFTFMMPETMGRAYLVLIFMLFINGSLSCFLGTAGWLVLSEIFPTAIRGFAMGCAVTMLWTTNASISLFFPIVVDRVGMISTFFGFMVLNMIAFAFVARFMPETRGRTLEELEDHLREVGTPSQ